ncbi:MAG: molecular chaperone TorD family protein [Coriobacteriia bacterium]|nr:molecular chaperone TorD family protein [Coriobacteriia bacterium]
MSNQENESKIALALAHRAYRYTLLHLVFGAEPNANLMSKAFSPESREAFAETEPLASYLNEHADESDSAAFLADAGKNYRALFYAMGDANVVAWESPYLDDNGMLFQESTLDVREFYHQAGLKLQAEKQFPDDHIGAMMDFLAHLSIKTYEFFANGEDDKASELIATQRSFIEKHLLHWLGKFSNQVAEKDKQGFYVAFAQGMQCAVSVDYDELTKSLENIG